MKKCIVLFFLLFSCQKRISPSVFSQIGEVMMSGNSFQTKDGIYVISFPNPFGRCIIKLYPESYVKISKAYTKTAEAYVEISDFGGKIFLISEECNITWEFLSCNNSKLFLKKYEKTHIEIIEGKCRYKNMNLRRGQGFIPSENRIYLLKSKVKVVFPRDGQELVIPFFLWEKKDGVSSYFIEFAIDPDFLNPIFYTKVEGNKFFPDKLTLDIFSKKIFWQVLYEDAEGIGGLPSEPRQVIVP